MYTKTCDAAMMEHRKFFYISLPCTVIAWRYSSEALEVFAEERGIGKVEVVGNLRDRS